MNRLQFKFPHILSWPGIIALCTKRWGWAGFGASCVVAAVAAGVADKVG